MRSLWRVLLLCLMAVALPVQGFAAAGMQHCQPIHERTQTVTAPHAVHHGDAHAHPHDTASAPQAHEAGAGAVDHAPVAEKSHAVAAVAKCSACAACCVGLGLPASALQLPKLPAVGPQPATIPMEAAAFLTGGLDRPPRPFLA